jgi:hypothetical protein
VENLHRVLAVTALRRPAKYRSKALNRLFKTARPLGCLR